MFEFLTLRRKQLPFHWEALVPGIFPWVRAATYAIGKSLTIPPRAEFYRQHSLRFARSFQDNHRWYVSLKAPFKHRIRSHMVIIRIILADCHGSMARLFAANTLLRSLILTTLICRLR